MKECFRCKETKPLTAFYEHPEMADGRLNKCVLCTRNDVKQHREANLERIREYDRERGKSPHRLEAVKTRALAYPERATAVKRLNAAVKGGKVVRWPVCAVPECNERPQAHHPDYSRPLDVVWLCPAHHAQTHALTHQSRYEVRDVDEVGYEVDAAGTFVG